MQALHPAVAHLRPGVDVPQGGQEIIQAAEFSGDDREAIGRRLGGGHRAEAMGQGQAVRPAQAESYSTGAGPLGAAPAGRQAAAQRRGVLADLTP